MSIYGTFIGIDRYSDPSIRDLTGALRDATALWALFCDTISDIKPELIVNTDATLERIHNSLKRVFTEAGPEDTIILSFAGHGTHDNCLVVFDTASDRLSETTIPIDELATLFKESRAKIIICILDCCFSGKAPARVFEDSPIPRESEMNLDTLAGEGRILIAASNINEPAYELPRDRHGILTRTLIEVLRTGTDSVSLLEAMDHVINKVRAEANKIGKEQNPVLFGSVKGGLTIPVLHPGKRFYSAFPEKKGKKISNNILDLRVFDLPENALKEWSTYFKDGLNPLQLDAINECRVLDGESLLVIAPTSAGKTFIGEMATVRAVIEGRKSIFLLPYRALVNEKYDYFSDLYGKKLGMRIIRCTGDYLDQTTLFVLGKYDIALLTFEMFLNLGVSNPAILSQLGLIVMDEVQFLTDPNRGITVELLLTFLLSAREKGVTPQIIALSAVIGDINYFDEWLGSKKLVTYERPVPLKEGVLDRNGVFQYSESGEIGKIQLLPQASIRQRKSEASAQDVIVPLVKMLLQQEDEKIIIFRNQRGAARGCAAYLSEELSLPPASEVIASLPSFDPSSTSEELRSCLAGGTAFHNTNLTREERIAVERSFRKPESPVRVLAATTTIAAGINTPASTVILAEKEFIGENGRPFTVAEYKNMAGRAGRLGFKETGKSIILADTSYEREALFSRYVMGKLESFRSSFDPKDINTWIIRLLAQIERIPRRDVARVLANAYSGFLEAKKQPDWQTKTQQRLEGILRKMIELGLVEEEDGHVKLTLLGRVCGTSTFSFESSMRFVELLRTVDINTLTPERLMASVQVLQESDNVYTSLLKRGRKEAIRPREVVERYGNETARLLQRFAKDEFDYFGRCKRAAILWDWISGVPIGEIEKRYSTTPYAGAIGHGDVRNFADSTRYHLRSGHQIMSHMFPGQGPEAELIEKLLVRLEIGIPTGALGLLSIPVRLIRGEYLELIRKGVTVEQAFWDLPEESMKKLLRPSIIDELEPLRPRRKPT